MPEIFGSASYYGIGKILKKYSKFPVWLPLPVNVQHGFLGRRATSHDALKSAPENWYWDEETLKSHMKFFPGIKGRTVGSPFLYLLRCINRSGGSNTEKKGTIVFPAHSSAFTKVTSDFNSFADQLSELPEKFHPITICAYHIDYERGDYKPFMERGFGIVTNGSGLYDTTFLYNFINNVKDKKFAISNSHSSALYFSSALGVIAYHMGPAFDVDNKDPHTMIIDLNREGQNCLDRFPEYFSFPNANIELQQKCVMQILGQDYLLDSKEMKRILWRKAFTRNYVVTLIKTFTTRFLVSMKRFLRIPKFRLSGNENQ